ncbi:MAG: acetyl-CoA carboxylase biotin carboxyl carrier protein [Vulcanimicrobiaceae bacterium]
MTFDDVIASRIRPLAETLMREGLASVRIGEPDLEIELSRSVVSAPGTSSPAIATGDDGVAPAYDVIASEVVGRVRFLRPAPVVGTTVEADRELAFVETLGIRNPIRSRGPGRIAVIYVEEGQAVDYGAPLFAIDRNSVV